MKLYVQWTTSPANPRWELLDSKDWKNTPKKPEPPDGKLDDAKGLVHQINVQGMRFSADHYAVIDEGESIRVIAWNDDPGDYSEEEFEADEVIFYPVARYDGIINTRIQHVRYLNQKRYKQLKNAGLRGTGGKDIIKRWNEFKKPSDELTRHGSWTTPETNELYNKEPYESWEGWYNP